MTSRVSLFVCACLAVLPLACAENPASSPVRTPETARVSAPAAGRYLVTLRAGGDAATLGARAVASVGGHVRYVFRDGGSELTAVLTPTAAEALRHLPEVAAVREMTAAGRLATVWNAGSWGLDRIDQTSLPLSGTFDDYGYEGAGVSSYVIDTGVDFTNPHFGGRVRVLLDLQGGNGSESNCLQTPTGHGTHVAGIVASDSFGVAKSDTVVAVRVASCYGSFYADDLARGIDSVIVDHQRRGAVRVGTSSVINLSLSYPGNRFDSPHVDSAVARALRAGITVVAGAAFPYDTTLVGSARSNACNYTPSRVPGVITVAATDRTDAYAPAVSNEGPCVDLFAPGVDILSVGLNGGTAVMSGSSQATPFTTGVAARYLQTHPAAVPDSVQAWIRRVATPGVVINPGSAPNLLLFSPSVYVKRRACC